VGIAWGQRRIFIDSEHGGFSVVERSNDIIPHHILNDDPMHNVLFFSFSSIPLPFLSGMYVYWLSDPGVYFFGLMFRISLGWVMIVKLWSFGD